jgi:hypothetical protein
MALKRGVACAVKTPHPIPFPSITNDLNREMMVHPFHQRVLYDWPKFHRLPHLHRWRITEAAAYLWACHGSIQLRAT